MKRRRGPYQESQYSKYKNRYDYAEYIKLCAMREGKPLKDMERILNMKLYKVKNICANIAKISKHDAVLIANHYNIRIKLWATKSVYIFALFEDTFSPDEREEILRQRIWEA